MLYLVAVHKNYDKSRNVGYRFYNTEDGKIVEICPRMLLDNLGDNVYGIKFNGKDFEGTNGDLSRYTQLIDNIPVGATSLIILEEGINKEYNVVNHLGILVKMSTKELVDYSTKESIANGKIINRDGKNFISSISGEYPKSKELKDMEFGSKTRAKLQMLGVDDYELDENYILRANSKEIDSLVIGRGCLGVAPAAFLGSKKLKEVVLPATCLAIGAEAFKDCIELEVVVIPEGVIEIYPRAFYGCKKLKEIKLPNSIRKVGYMAFAKSGVKKVSLGINRFDLDATAFERQVVKTIRR